MRQKQVNRNVRIGTIIQKIEKLESHADRAAAAAAVRDKIGPKAFKKHKRREYIEGLIAEAGDRYRLLSNGDQQIMVAPAWLWLAGLP